MSRHSGPSTPSTPSTEGDHRFLRAAHQLPNDASYSGCEAEDAAIGTRCHRQRTKQGTFLASLRRDPCTLRTGPGNRNGGQIMLYYALVFFVIAIIAAAFGFGGIAAGAASIAKILFIIFLIIFLVTLVMGLMRR
jgi:uncharacterized membrane protein YtjA (UPF0391 family)